MEGSSPEPDRVTELAQGPGPPWFRSLLAACAALYLGGIFLDVAGAPLHKLVPHPLHYFMQVAKLFPYAVTAANEFRAEGYSCADDVFSEIDVRPFFPMRANDKENRFERALFFYRYQSVVMHALDQYIVVSSKRNGASIGGVRFLTLRIPIPPPGHVIERYRRKTIAEYPAEYRKVWYQTPGSLRRARCNEGSQAHEPATP